MENIETIYHIFGAYNVNLIDIENICKFSLPPYQIKYIQNIIINTPNNNNPFSICNIDPRFLNYSIKKY